MGERDDKIVELLIEIRNLLAEGPSSGTKRAFGTTRRTPQADKLTASENSAFQTALAARNDADAWNAIWDKGKPLERWLAVLAIAEDETGEGASLSGPEIAQVLVERFRLNGVQPTNVTRDLKKARQYVGRRSRGAAYEYFLTRKGLQWIIGRRDALGSPK